MNQFNYYLNDCILQGWRNVGWAFRAWSRFITSDYRDYNYYNNWTEEEKEENVRFDFWDGLEDGIMPKGELEYLLEIIKGIDNGTEKLIPFTQEMFDKLTKLVDGVEVDDTLDVMFDDD